MNILKVKAWAKARSGLILHALEPREGGEIKQTKPPLAPNPSPPRGEGENRDSPPPQRLQRLGELRRV